MLDIFLSLFPAVLGLTLGVAVLAVGFLFSLDALVNAVEKAEPYLPKPIRDYLFPVSAIIFLAFFSSAVLSGVFWGIQQIST